jgi:hypothetical protein
MNAQIYSFDTACQTECGGEGNFFGRAGRMARPGATQFDSFSGQSPLRQKRISTFRRDLPGLGQGMLVEWNDERKEKRRQETEYSRRKA